MKKRTTATLLSTGLLALTANAAKTPNILFIFMEDMGLQIGPYGDTTAPTPRLDAFAREGVVFENAHCTQPTCSPSRSSLFTGLYPHQNGQMGLADSGGFSLKQGIEPFLKQLKEQNYYTGRSYKIHVDPETRIKQYFDQNYDYARFEKDGTNAHDHRQAIKYMAEFLAERKPDKPFFYMAQTADTHREFFQKNLANEPFQSIEGYKKQTPETVRPLPSFGDDINFGFARDVADYYNAIQRVDAFVGGCLDLLEKHGLTDDTIVIFSADHGPCYGRGKLSLADFGTHVPFIVRWPGSPRKGARSNALVSLIDLPSTFVEIAGTNIPAHYMGKSIRPLMMDSQSDTDFRKQLFTEYTTHCPLSDYAPARAIQDGRYKLIHHLLAGVIPYPEDGVHAEGCPDIWAALKTPKGTTARKTYDEFVNPPVFQLFDLQADPHEHHNLADSTQHADILEMLKNELQSWRKETDDPFLDPDYTKRFTAHYLNHQGSVLKWAKENPNKNVWKTDDVIRPDWNSFIERNPAVVPIPRGQEDWLINRQKKVANELATRDLTKVDTVFMGDSITQGWLEEGRVFWDKSFLHALNLGVAGDRTEHVLYRLIRKADGGTIGHLDDSRLSPKRIVLMIGTNNLFKHDADQIIQGIKATRDRLVELEPQAQLILCSVLPTADEARNRNLVIPVNSAIQKLDGVHWLDLYSHMVDEQGRQRKELFKDQVHLSTQGYQVWHDRLIALLAGI